MTIFSVGPDDRPMALTEYSVNQCNSTAVVPEVIQKLAFCFCKYDCDYKQPTFVGVDDYETDRSDFLVDVPDSAGSFQIFLIKSETGVETPLTDNTFGTYFSLGYKPTNPTKGGYLINWGLVQSVLGYGNYKVKRVVTAFGNDYEDISHEFEVKPYSVKNAIGTVRIEGVKNGKILGGTDYTDLDWIFQVRFKGRFWEIDPQQQIVYVPGSDRKQKQVSDQTVLRYQLDTIVSKEILVPLKNDSFSATDLFITDYNARSFEDLRQINVIRDQFTKFEPKPNSRYGSFSIEFTQKKQDIIKWPQ